MSCFYRKSRFVHANTRMVSEGKLSHIISLSHLRSPLPPLSFFSFCPRVLWSGRSDLGEPELVWTLSVCRGALRKLSGHNQGPWLLFEADCRCIIGSLSPRGRGNTHTHKRAHTHSPSLPGRAPIPGDWTQHLILYLFLGTVSVILH